MVVVHALFKIIVVIYEKLTRMKMIWWIAFELKFCLPLMSLLAIYLVLGESGKVS